MILFNNDDTEIISYAVDNVGIGYVRRALLNPNEPAKVVRYLSDKDNVCIIECYDCNSEASYLVGVFLYNNAVRLLNKEKWSWVLEEPKNQVEAKKPSLWKRIKNLLGKQ